MKKFVLAILLYATTANAVNVTFWMASFYNPGNNTRYMPIGGHWLQDGGASTPDFSPQVVPQGTLTKLACITDNPFTDTNTYTLYRNGVATSATCSFSGPGTTECAWTGRIAIAQEDTLAILFTRTPSITTSSHSCFTTLELNPGQNLDWPFTS